MPFEIPPPSFPTPVVPRPTPRDTPEASASPTLHRLSRPRSAALRHAARRCGRLLLTPGATAIAAREGRPLAEAGGEEEGAKKSL